MNSVDQSSRDDDGDETRGVDAVAWAAEVALDHSLLAHPPRRPTPADLRAVSTDDFRDQMDRLLMARYPEPGLDALEQIGVLDVWLPELSAMVGFGDGEFRHKDVWKHTKQVVRQSVPRLEVRWGALLHDIGKPKTRSIDPNGEVHFFGHSEVGAAMFRKRVARRLGFEGREYDRVHFLILCHLRASQYDGSWTDSAVRRFAREMGTGLKDLLDLSRADITTKRIERKKRGLRQISELADRIARIEEMDARVPPLPKGVGDAISAAFGIPPSKRIGDLKRALEDAVESGAIAAGEESSYYVAWLAKHRETFGL